MKQVFFLNFCFFILFISAQTQIVKKLKDFETLKVYSEIDLELVKSDKQEILITGEKSDKVKIKENNNILKVKLSFPEISSNGKVKAILYYNKPIAIIDANESSSIISKEVLEQNHIEIKSQEGAFINLAINTKHLTVKASSGGVIKLSGTAKNQTVKLDLRATYHGYNLIVDNVSSVNAGSGAKAEVHTGETLNAKVSFGGTILYKGKPEVIDEKKVIGGTIEPRN